MRDDPTLRLTLHHRSATDEWLSIRERRGQAAGSIAANHDAAEVRAS